MGTTRARTTLWLAAVAAATLVAACGGSNGGEPAATQATPTDAATPTEAQAGRPKVGMAIIVNNLPVDENLAGFKAVMEENGYIEGETIEYEERNAFGETQNADLIARQTVEGDPDLIYVVGTPIVIALHQQTDSIPVVFSLMTDPVGAGVVESFEQPGGNFTGTSDAVSPPVYFDLIEELVPSAETVGILGDTGEQNSQAQIDAFTAETQARGLDVTVAPTATSNDVLPAVRSLEGRVDVLLVGADGTVLSAADALLQGASDAGLPLVVAGSEYASQGALAGVGPDFRTLGEKSAEIVVDILNGGKPEEIPVVDAVSGGGLAYAINIGTADKLGITIPTALASEATLVGG